MSPHRPGETAVPDGSRSPVIDAAELRARHDDLLGRLRAIAADAGHDPRRLTIVAVTKTHGVEVVRAARDAGIRRLGESRVQEAEAKIASVPDVEWHLIGRLQANKVRRAVRAFGVIHSIDGVALLERVDRIGAEEGRRPRVLLEVNVTGEAAKAGMSPGVLAAIRAPSSVELAGLMTIAPMGVSEEAARAVFRRLRELRDGLADRLGVALPELSMGMSADAPAAAAEGATLVRVGTALLGARRTTG